MGCQGCKKVGFCIGKYILQIIYKVVYSEEGKEEKVNTGSQHQ